MYQPKVILTVSDETVKRLLDAFDKLIVLSNMLEDIIRYFIKKEHEQRITILFSIEETCEPECDCVFSLDDNENVVYDSKYEKDALIQYVDSMYRATLIIVEKYNNRASIEIGKKVESAKNMYKEHVEELETIIKTIIGEQTANYVDVDENELFDDAIITMRYRVNSKGEIVCYQANEEEEYDKHGKCELISDKYKLVYSGVLQGILYTMSRDFDKKVDLPIIY